MKQIYLNIKPRAELQDIISGIWIQQTPDGEDVRRPTRVVPSGYPEMTFFYCDPVYELISGESVFLPRSSVNGQKTRFKEYGSFGNVGSIIFRLFPWGLSSFFPDGAAAFTDLNVDLRDCVHSSFDGEIERMENLLVSGCSIKEKIAAIENWLIKVRREPSGLLQGRIQSMTRFIAANLGAAPVHKVAEEFSLGRRALEKCFKAATGLTPKTFSSIVRFQSSIYHSEPDNRYLDYYYDQSHYIRSIKSFTGFTPGQIAAHRSRSLLSETFNRDSHLYNTVYLNSSII